MKEMINLILQNFIPQTEQDVINIVQLAVNNSAYCSQSGGHSYVGASSCNDDNCYQIDMKYFNKAQFIRNDSNVVTSINVGVGQKLGKHINYYIQKM